MSGQSPKAALTTGLLVGMGLKGAGGVAGRILSKAASAAPEAEAAIPLSQQALARSSGTAPTSPVFMPRVNIGTAQAAPEAATVAEAASAPAGPAIHAPTGLPLNPDGTVNARIGRQIIKVDPKLLENAQVGPPAGPVLRPPASAAPPPAANPLLEQAQALQQKIVAMRRAGLSQGQIRAHLVETGVATSEAEANKFVTLALDMEIPRGPLLPEGQRMMATNLGGKMGPKIPGPMDEDLSALLRQSIEQYKLKAGGQQ